MRGQKNSTCQFAVDAYLGNRTGAEVLSHSHALGQSPCSFFNSQVSGPGMDSYSCRGLKRLAVYTLNDQGHYHTGHNSGQHVQHEVPHKRHLLVLKLGGCPATILSCVSQKSKASVEEVK